MPISADTLGRLVDETRARTLQPGRLGMAQQRGGGTVLARRPTGLQPAARQAVAGWPFDIRITSSGATRTVTVRAGTINSLLPSNYLSGVTVPETGTRYLVLDVTVTSGAITAAALAADSSVPPAIAPSAGTPPIAFKVLLGVIIDARAVKVWGQGNIQALPVEAFRLQKSVPVAGQVPYDVYYTWSLAVL